MFRGANLTGGETEYTDWASSGVPQQGTHYLFVSNTDIDTCVAAGMTAFRLLFSWEAFSNAAYLSALKSRIAYIMSRGCRVILDIHPGDATLAPGFKGTKITDGSALQTQFCDLWAGIARMYIADPLVEFGVMNEPNGQAPSVWFKTAQKVIDAIRATGNTSWIWMPGGGWSGAGEWSTVNGPYWNLVDPLNHTGVQAHLYLDANAGGGATDVVSTAIGVTRMTNVVTWARSKGLKVFLGEVAVKAGVTNANAAWANLVAYMNANQDVVAGWCWWAYGPPAWWGGYQFTLCNASPQMKLAFPATVPVPDPVPVPTPTPDPSVAVLQAQVATLTAQVAALTSQLSALSAKVAAAKLALS